MTEVVCVIIMWLGLIACRTFLPTSFHYAIGFIIGTVTAILILKKQHTKED